MSKQPGSHNTPRVVVEEILRLHIEERYTYRQQAEKFQKPFKTIQNMIHSEYKKQRQYIPQPNRRAVFGLTARKPPASDGK